MTDVENSTTEEEVPEQDTTEQEQAASPTDEVDVAELQKRLAEAEAAQQDANDKLLRAHAEMENIRRRSERELENAHKYGMEKFATELLPIIDSLEFGLVAASADDADITKVREGTELTIKMLASMFDKFGINSVHPIDEAFDPEFHQAMTMIEHPEKEPNTVIDVMQKGYMLNNRLIRPAMVVVSKAPANTDKESDEKT
ncbi:Heat shock protein GrpE [hydrothermal vent metagenome]|uniref:Heat shock protein GrpE n=1 Tax=hydrothermal vent metagenome TaxID=652676 RepID=A0A3B0ZR34_9ZZZZ